MISVRPAVVGDEADLLAWRNDAATVAASLQDSVVAPADHARWLREVLADPMRVLYIGEAGSPPAIAVGMSRFDIAPDRNTAEVSINLAPAQRGQRLSRPLLEASIAQLAIDQHDVVELTAIIRGDNIASRRLFESVGFLMTKTGHTFDTYRRALG